MANQIKKIYVVTRIYLREMDAAVNLTIPWRPHLCLTSTHIVTTKLSSLRSANALRSDRIAKPSLTGLHF